MLSRFLKNRAVSGFLIGAIITLLLLPLMLLNIFSSLNAHFTDSLYTRHEPSSKIVIIAVDNKSTSPAPEGLGRFSQWSRDNFTQLLQILKKENPKVIAIDFLFHNPTTTINYQKLLELEEQLENKSNDEQLKIYEKFLTENKSSLRNPVDEKLGETFRSFDNLILAASLQADEKSLIKPLAKFSIKAKLGIINAYLDEKGILRNKIPSFYIESENRNYDDLALTTAKTYLEKEQIDLPLQDGELLVNFFGDPFSYNYISFVDVLNGNHERNFFKDKIVLIGPTAKEIHDEFFTPRSNKTPMPGVEFHANEIQTILESKFLLRQSIFLEISTIFVLATALTIALNYLGILFSILLSLATIIIYIFAAYFFYSRGLLINMFYPFLAIGLGYLGSWIYKYFIADKGKREIKSAFGHYLSPELVDQIAKNPELVKLGGEKKVVTVFFSDIKDSTAYSEKISAEAWVSQINEYFTVMEFVLKSYGGTLDKYEGDAIMGFFNAPLTQPDHVVRAYMAALAMRKALLELHEKWRGEGKPLIEFRIGINTGEALVGNFGSRSRFDYTVMGDTVNTASRLESSANKSYGTKTIVSGFEGVLTPEQLSKVVLRELDTVLLPGKKEPVKLFELVCLAADLNEDGRNLIAKYAQGLILYRDKQFDKALVIFESLKDDSPSKIMSDRCRILAEGSSIPELDESMTYRILNK